MLQTLNTILTPFSNWYFIAALLITVVGILHVAAFQRKQILAHLAEELHLILSFDYWILRPSYKLTGEYKGHKVLIYDVPSGSLGPTRIVVDNSNRLDVWPAAGDTFGKRLKFSVQGPLRLSNLYASPELIKRGLDTAMSQHS